MGSLLDNATLGHHNNVVGGLDGTETVSNYNGGATLGSYIQSSLNNAFTLGVKSRGSFVEEQYLRVTDDSSGNSNTLLLTTTEQEATLTNIGLVSLWELSDKVMGV
jgi:hypothetical protein